MREAHKLDPHSSTTAVTTTTTTAPTVGSSSSSSSKNAEPSRKPTTTNDSSQLRTENNHQKYGSGELTAAPTSANTHSGSANGVRVSSKVVTQPQQEKKVVKAESGTSVGLLGVGHTSQAIPGLDFASDTHSTADRGAGDVAQLAKAAMQPELSHASKLVTVTQLLQQIQTQNQQGPMDLNPVGKDAECTSG